MAEIIRVYHGSRGGLQGAIRSVSDSTADFGGGFFDGQMTMMEHDLCNVQGKLFQLAATSGYDSVAFIDAFLHAKRLLTVYLGCHTLNCDQAIRRIKEGA